MDTSQYRDGLFTELGHKKFIRSMQNYLLTTLGLELHPMVSLPTVFLRTATRYQARPALYDKQRDTFVGISYGDMLLQVNQFAAALIALNIAPTSNIGLFLRNCSSWAIGDFGIMFAGMVTVPIYETLSGNIIEIILEETETPLVVIENGEKLAKVTEIWSHLPHLKYIVVVDPTGVDLSDKIMSFQGFRELGARYLHDHPQAVEQRYTKLEHDDVASIVYTSGTTGRPKGVMLTHKNFLSNFYGVVVSVEASCQDRFLSILPLCHVLERTASHFMCLLLGGTMYYAESIKTMARDLAMVQPTVCIGVPRVFEKVYASLHENLATSSALKQAIFRWAARVGEELYAVNNGQKTTDNRFHHREEDLDRSWQKPLSWQTKLAGYIAHKLVYNKIKAKLGGKIRFFISGGAPLSAKITTFFRHLGVFIFEGYGLTETAPVIAFNFHTNFEAGTVGRLLPYVDVKFSPHGEILVRGPNVTSGYYKNQEATIDAIDADSWFHTGDIGCFTKYNNLKITGRIKEILITSGGKNVPIGPIESFLNQSALVCQGILLGEQKPFVSCLIFPDFIAIKTLARKLDIAETNVAKLCEHEGIRAVYQEILDDINRPLSNYEKIKKFMLVPYELTITAGELTPTLKVKRTEVMAKFADQINHIYATH